MCVYHEMFRTHSEAIASNYVSEVKKSIFLKTSSDDFKEQLRLWIPGYEEETAKIKLLLFALSPNIHLFSWIFILTLLLNQTWVHLPSVQQSLLTGEESSRFNCNVSRSTGSSSSKDLNFLMTFREGFYFIYKTLWCGLFWGDLSNLWQHCIHFTFQFFGSEACGILVPQPGMEPAFPRWKVKS